MTGAEEYIAPPMQGTRQGCRPKNGVSSDSRLIYPGRVLLEWRLAAMKTVHKQTKRILLVDDDADMREITRLLLEKYGHRVTAADCGSEALRVFSINPGYFDVVLLDQEMPDLKGTDIAPRLVGLRSNVPIVLYTGCVDEDLVEKARKAGIKEVATKPLPIDLLLEAIGRNSNGAPVGRRRTKRIESRLQPE